MFNFDTYQKIAKKYASGWHQESALSRENLRKLLHGREHKVLST